ncbi:hypothetical protein ULMA_24990 [Patiriisocius marinus]|uniref:Uncharacterized protein n=2 Tax=Patiriisocius marinus TaxID=1397112 RepID=A0A5J4J3K0_9FLAO|nr:hypothetical protein ULMA_24990 [Patiriisocius marinus]
MFSNEEGIISLDTKTDSLIDTEYNQNRYDLLAINNLLKMQMTDFLTKTPIVNIHLEIIKDSIWRHKTQDGVMLGDYIMIHKNSGVLHYYDKLKSWNYRKHDLFAENHLYELIENRDNRKEINGYDCYQLILILQENDSDFGNTIYEMYVTNQINLPIHSVINLTKLVSNTFPMEISISSEKSPNISEKYTLIEMD